MYCECKTVRAKGRSQDNQDKEVRIKYRQKGMDSCPMRVLCVLSGRGLCDGLIAHPEESYQLRCVLACDLGTSRMRRLKLINGCKCRIEEEELSITN